MSAATGNIDSSSASASLFPSPERARRSRDELSDGDEPTLLSQTKRRRTTEVSRLTDRVASLEDEVQDLKDYRKKTSERHKGIVKAIQQLEERADAGQATQAKQQEELVSVQNLAASITSAAPLTQAEQATADNIRDNALNVSASDLHT
jgi:TolA-binding protein